MILNTKRIHNSFWRNAFKSFICRQEKATAAAIRPLCTKIVIVGNGIWVKNYLTVLVYTKTIVNLSVSVYIAAMQFGKYSTLATST